MKATARIGAILLALSACLATIGAQCAVATTHGSRTAAVRPFPFQSLPVARRATVTFTVSRKILPAPGFPQLPTGVGDYFALYFPQIRQGWVDMRDPGSDFGWSTQFPLIGSKRFPSFVPHRRYQMLVAVQQPGRIPLPFPMHVISTAPTSFRVTAETQPAKLLTSPSSVAIGSVPDQLRDLPIESTGIVLDWAADQSLTESVQGDTCPAALPIGGLLCPHRNLSTYVITQTGFGSGTPLQITLGEGFDQPVDGAYLSAYAANLPTPFDKATIVAFGIDPRSK
jgi:hypothetical protein